MVHLDLIEQGARRRQFDLGPRPHRPRQPTPTTSTRSARPRRSTAPEIASGRRRPVARQPLVVPQCRRVGFHGPRSRLANSLNSLRSISDARVWWPAVVLALRTFLRLEWHLFSAGISWAEAKAAIIRDAVRASLAHPSIHPPTA